MNKDRIEGMVHQAKGAVKAEVGKMTNNPDMQAAGMAEQTLGKMQNSLGKLKDAAQNELKKSA